MKQDQDLRSIIASHEAELTDMEHATLPNTFIVEARQHSCLLLVSLSYFMFQRQL